MRARKFVPNVDGCMALERRALMADPAAYIGFDGGSPDPADPTGHVWSNAVGGNTEIAISAFYDVSTVEVTVDNIVEPLSSFSTVRGAFTRGGGTRRIEINGPAWDYHIPFYWDETTGDRTVDVWVNYANGETPDWDSFLVHVDAPRVEYFEITDGVFQFGLWTQLGDRLVPYGVGADQFAGIGFGFSATSWQDMRYSIDAVNSTQVGGKFGFVQFIRGDARVEYSNGAVWSSTTRDLETGRERDVLDANNAQSSIYYIDYLQEVAAGAAARVPPVSIVVRDYPGIMALAVDGPYPHIISCDLTITTYAVWVPYQGIPIVVGAGGWAQRGLARNNRVVDEPLWENAFGQQAVRYWNAAGSSYTPPSFVPTTTDSYGLLPNWEDNVSNTFYQVFWPGGGSPGPSIAPGNGGGNWAGVAPSPVADDSTFQGYYDAIAAHVDPFVARRRRPGCGPLHALHRRA